ncbi:MAG: flavin reductase family protein [Nitriliruptorales bacterium]|nr:flavin reductase family protein [Nitriliruptorales bacterium]
MAYLEIDPAAQTSRENYFLLTGLVVPRPIAWVSSLSENGVRNLAPHSYFNIVSSDPPIVHFTQTGRKDTLTNVETTGEFVINFVSVELAEAMNLTAADFPHDEDEFAWAGLEAAASTRVSPPRVAAVRAAFECRVRTILEMGNGNMVFGDVVAVHVDESVFRDGRVDMARLAAVGRLGGSWYSAVDDPFRLDRPTWANLRRATE